MKRRWSCARGVEVTCRRLARHLKSKKHSDSLRRKCFYRIGLPKTTQQHSCLCIGMLHCILVALWFILAPFWVQLIARGTLLAQCWSLLTPSRIHFDFVFPSTSFLSAPEATKHLQPTARHPCRKNFPFQGHVRNLVKGNLRTDARVINICHI